MIRRLLFPFAVLLQTACLFAGPQIVEVDANRVLSDVTTKPVGLVSCFLLDSDRHFQRKRTMVEVYQKLGIGSVRFPYGFLANNYLWTSPPYDKPVSRLEPRVASMHETPGKWKWAVNPDGTIRNGLDFDEFIGQCRAAEVEPVIVINVMSWKYKNGPSRDQLRDAAAAWVRYANIQKGYGVKYWQIGNEQDHHPDILSLPEYKAVYDDFTRAMLEVDPKILVGPAVIGNVNWAWTILKAFPERVHFICAHQYQWSDWSVEQWRDHSDPVIPNILGIQKLIEDSGNESIEILVTEANSVGKWKDVGYGQQDVVRTLCLAEMLLHMSSLRQVKFIHVWDTHGPWRKNGTQSVLDLDNNFRVPAVLIWLVNHGLLDEMVETERVSGPLRSFASRSKQGDTMSVFVVNKADKAVETVVKFKGFKPSSLAAVSSLRGNSYLDMGMALSRDVSARVIGDSLAISVPPFGVTMIRAKGAP